MRCEHCCVLWRAVTICSMSGCVNQCFRECYFLIKVTIRRLYVPTVITAHAWNRHNLVSLQTSSNQDGELQKEADPPVLLQKATSGEDGGANQTGSYLKWCLQQPSCFIFSSTSLIFIDISAFSQFWRPEPPVWIIPQVNRFITIMTELQHTSSNI